MADRPSDSRSTHWSNGSAGSRRVTALALLSRLLFRTAAVLLFAAFFVPFVFAGRDRRDVELIDVFGLGGLVSAPWRTALVLFVLGLAALVVSVGLSVCHERVRKPSADE